MSSARNLANSKREGEKEGSKGFAKPKRPERRYIERLYCEIS
jgi:hypothetical protein